MAAVQDSIDAVRIAAAAADSQKAEDMVQVLNEFSNYANQARERFTDLDKRSAASIRNSF